MHDYERLAFGVALALVDPLPQVDALGALALNVQRHGLALDIGCAAQVASTLRGAVAQEPTRIELLHQLALADATFPP